jgi:prophage antirepressor-like protein
MNGDVKMQNQINIICQQEVLGKDFKVYGDYENPLFLAKDVAQWVENSNTSQMLRSVDSEEKALYTMYRVDGSTNKSWFLTEDGLYEVLMQSRKPLAKEFKAEVKKILKSIRKHGGYVNCDLLDEFLENLEVATDFFKTLNHERKMRVALENRLEEIEPKAEYYDNVLMCGNCFPVSHIAKDYGMTAQQFNELLHDLGVQYKVGGVWVLYKKYANHRFTVTQTVQVCGGKYVICTFWTHAGREFLYNLFADYGFFTESEREAFHREYEVTSSPTASIS